MARIDTPVNAADERPEVLNATRARQGSRGRHIFWVLVISITLAALALFGSLAFHKDEIDDGGAQTTSVAGAAAFDTAPGSNQTAPTPPSAP